LRIVNAPSVEGEFSIDNCGLLADEAELLLLLLGVVVYAELLVEVVFAELLEGVISMIVGSAEGKLVSILNFGLFARRFLMILLSSLSLSLLLSLLSLLL